jgi:hypothetical protein
VPKNPDGLWPITWSPRFTSQQLKHLQESSRFNDQLAICFQTFSRRKPHMLPWNSNQRATRRFPTSHTMLQRAFLHRGIWFVSSDPESWLSSTSAHTTKIDNYDSSKICVASTTLLLPTRCGPQVLWQLTNWQRGQQISSAPAEYCTELKHHFISYAWEGGKGPRVQNNKTQHRLKIHSRWFDMIQLMVSTCSNPWKKR